MTQDKLRDQEVEADDLHSGLKSPLKRQMKAVSAKDW